LPFCQVLRHPYNNRTVLAHACQEQARLRFTLITLTYRFVLRLALLQHYTSTACLTSWQMTPILHLSWRISASSPVLGALRTISRERSNARAAATFGTVPSSVKRTTIRCTDLSARPLRTSRMRIVLVATTSERSSCRR
jgi:hypothetical protein